jgi:hypothetical protein
VPVRVYDVVETARRYDDIREAAPNRGQRVEAIQKWCGGSAGDSWCCHFATFVYDRAYKGKSPIPRTGSCDTVLAVCRDQGWMVNDPQPGDLVFSMLGQHDAHHIGIVTVSEPLTAIAGNTSRDGTSSNGDGVYEHTISPKHKLFARVP